jgi:hypothetical protein
LKALHKEDRGGLTPIPAQQQGAPNAAFQVWAQSGKEIDKRRAVVENLNQVELKYLCNRGHYAMNNEGELLALKRQAGVWRWQGRAGLWSQEQWERAETRIENQRERR